MILVPTLRGFVAPLREGIRSLVLGLRILEGDTYSVNEANDLHLETNAKVLKKTEIARAKKLILEGLSMIEGCCPVACIVPALHCLAHYAEGAVQHGILRLLWMMSFGAAPLHTLPHHYTPPHTLPHHYTTTNPPAPPPRLVSLSTTHPHTPSHILMELSVGEITASVRACDRSSAVRARKCEGGQR